jgi:hypothetical protein
MSICDDPSSRYYKAYNGDGRLGDEPQNKLHLNVIGGPKITDLSYYVII